MIHFSKSLSTSDKKTKSTILINYDSRYSMRFNKMNKKTYEKVINNLK